LKVFESIHPAGLGVHLPDPVAFGVVIAVLGIAVLGILAGGRLSERLGIPLPLVVLGATALGAKVASLAPLGEVAVSRIVTVALIAVLFSGGMHLGRRRVTRSARVVLTLGGAGTLGTAALGALFAHFALGFAWYPALLVATAVAPTDPTIVFGLLGQNPVGGTVATVLEGESGANDPVGISLMTALLGAGGITLSGLADASRTFGLQVCVGAVVGVAGGQALVWLIRWPSLGGAGQRPIASAAAAVAIYGIAAAADGSGFLAVFIAGIFLGDEPFPHKIQVERFHSSLASLGEIAAFISLGLTLDLHVLAQTSTWAPGLAMGAVVAFVARPLVALGCLAGSGMSNPEKAFVAFAGLKGAVPILLGTYLLGSATGQGARLFGIVVVVAVASVAVQGSLLRPASAKLTRVKLKQSKRYSTPTEHPREP
jgi:cell volume regulation protein A